MVDAGTVVLGSMTYWSQFDWQSQNSEGYSKVWVEILWLLFIVVNRSDWQASVPRRQRLSQRPQRPLETHLSKGLN
jgi:hypothetical protein